MNRTESWSKIFHISLNVLPHRDCRPNFLKGKEKHNQKRTDRITGRFNDVLQVELFIVDIHFQKIVFNSVLVVWVKV